MEERCWCVDLTRGAFICLLAVLCNSLTENPTFIPRVLEVTKGQFCVIIGTVYMEMPLKPNVLEDIGRDVRFWFLNHACIDVSEHA